MVYRSGAYQASTITHLISWNWRNGSYANITTTPVIDTYEAIGLGTCSRALLLSHVVPPLLYRFQFAGPLTEGKSIVYRWAGKDKVRIKLLQNPKRRILLDLLKKALQERSASSSQPRRRSESEVADALDAAFAEELPGKLPKLVDRAERLDEMDLEGVPDHVSKIPG